MSVNVATKILGAGAIAGGATMLAIGTTNLDGSWGAKRNIEEREQQLREMKDQIHTVAVQEPRLAAIAKVSTRDLDAANHGYHENADNWGKSSAAMMVGAGIGVLGGIGMLMGGPGALRTASRYAAGAGAALATVGGISAWNKYASLDDRNHDIETATKSYQKDLVLGIASAAQ